MCSSKDERPLTEKRCRSTFAKRCSSRSEATKTVGGGNPRPSNGPRSEKEKYIGKNTTRALGARHRNARETRRSRTRDSKAIGKRYRSTSVERRSRTSAAAKAMPTAAAKASQAKTVGGGHPRSPNGARSETEKDIRKNPKKPAAWPTPFTKHVLDARSIVVSCGINNCVDSNYSNKSCREFSNWQRQTYGKVVKADHLSDNPGARERFLRSFRKNFPSLCEGRNIQVVDCTAFRNPGDDETGRRHTGAHPDIMHNVYTHKLFRQVHSDLRSMTPTGKNLVIIVCRSGRHRSVASALACSDVIRQRMYNGEQGTVRAVHLQQDTHWNRLCHQSCSECNLNNTRREKMMRFARNILKDIVPTNLPLGASPNRAAISTIPATESKFGGPKADKIDDHHADPSKGRWRDDKKNGYPEQPQSSRDEQKRRPREKDAESTNKKKKWQGDNDKQRRDEKHGSEDETSLSHPNEQEGCRESKEKGDEESSHSKWKKESCKDDREKVGQYSSKQRWSKGDERGESERGGDEISQPLPAGFVQPPPPPSRKWNKEKSRDDVDKAGDETFPKKWKKDSWWEGEEKEEAQSTRKKEEWQWDNEKEVHQSSWSKQKWRGGKEEWDNEPPRSSWGKRKWQGGEQEWKKESPRSRKWQGETGNGDEDFAQPTWKKQSWRQSEEKIDDHHAGSSKKKWSVDKEKEYQEQSQSSWDKERQPDEEDTDSKIKDQPNWNEKEGWREEDWREGKEKGDEESSQLKWKKESWKDVRENGGQDSSKQRWSKGDERGESERGGDEISQPLPAGFIPPPPPPSPSVPPTPSSPLSTARGSVGRSFQSDAAVVKANDNGIRVTVLKRVGPTRQEQSRKTDTNVAVLNQMLTDLRINSNYRKIPAGCIEGTSGMSHDSARIVKVDFENDMRGLSQLHHYMYTRPHSARVFRL